MKKKNMYDFNDGVDGVVVAKSLKHACKILCKTVYKSGFSKVYESAKLSFKKPECDTEWTVTGTYKIENTKSRVVGFYY